MGFVRKINQGETYVPSASGINATADKVNEFPRNGERNIRRSIDGALRIPVYNIGSSVIAAGSAVTLCYDSGNAVGGVVPVVKYDGSERPWGVMEDRLTENAVGSCVISGAVTVDVTYSGGTVHPYVVPSTSNPSKFTLSAEGMAKLLGLGANGKGSLVLLQMPVSGDKVKGAFDVTLDENGKIKVYDSSNPNGSYAGYVYSGSSSYRFQVTRLEPMVGVVYVDLNYESNTRSIAIAASLPSIETTDRRWVYSLATVSFGNDAYHVHRSNMPGDLSVTGRWVD